jgi:hypothetical protein
MPRAWSCCEPVGQVLRGKAGHGGGWPTNLCPKGAIRRVSFLRPCGAPTGVARARGGGGARGQCPHPGGGI